MWTPYKVTCLYHWQAYLHSAYLELLNPPTNEQSSLVLLINRLLHHGVISRVRIGASLTRLGDMPPTVEITKPGWAKWQAAFNSPRRVLSLFCFCFASIIIHLRSWSAGLLLSVTCIVVKTLASDKLVPGFLASLGVHIKDWMESRDRKPATGLIRIVYCWKFVY